MSENTEHFAANSKITENLAVTVDRGEVVMENEVMREDRGEDLTERRYEYMDDMYMVCFL